MHGDFSWSDGNRSERSSKKETMSNYNNAQKISLCYDPIFVWNVPCRQEKSLFDGFAVHDAKIPSSTFVGLFLCFCWLDVSSFFTFCLSKSLVHFYAFPYLTDWTPRFFLRLLGFWHLDICFRRYSLMRTFMNGPVYFWVSTIQRAISLYAGSRLCESRLYDTDIIRNSGSKGKWSKGLSVLRCPWIPVLIMGRSRENLGTHLSVLRLSFWPTSTRQSIYGDGRRMTQKKGRTFRFGLDWWMKSGIGWETKAQQQTTGVFRFYFFHFCFHCREGVYHTFSCHYIRNCIAKIVFKKNRKD